MKLETWDSAQVKKNVGKRFQDASASRQVHENRWLRNEASVYANGLPQAGFFSPGGTGDAGTAYSSPFPAVDGSISEVNIAYTFKNFRYIHAQMSSNPPSVVMRPTTSDADDHRKADAADRVVRWAIRHYMMQERIDQFSLSTLLYGMGVIKSVWDSSIGDIIDYDEERGEVTLEGDIAISIPFIWNIYLDPDAKAISDIKWVIERIYIDYDEACVRWPDKKELLEKARVQKSGSAQAAINQQSNLKDDHYNSVELLEYWETGLPSNGYLGRFCVTTCSGDEIEACRPSPFRFKKAGAVSQIEQRDDITDEEKEALIKKLPEQARLPYRFLTDIDVPNSVYGKSNVEYTAQLQENLARLDSARLDNIQAHSANKLILPESAEIVEMSNSPWDIVKISGNQPAYQMSPAQTMPDMTAMRQNTIDGINDVWGVNESMFGQQSREQAAAAMQYATNQGNAIRRRLFNKYVLAVEGIYLDILSLIRKHWTTSRMIHVIGKEKALEAVDLKGADIDGGYDVIGEYGVSLSLDPITRRQEIITMQPLFEKAGVPARKTLQLMKLAELDGAYDKLDRAGDRQKEIFDEMIATGSYIPPKPQRDHENMIAWALDYFMTSEFELLPPETQALCERHNQERAALAAQEAGATAPAQNLPPGAPGPAGQVEGELPTQAGPVPV